MNIPFQGRIEHILKNHGIKGCFAIHPDAVGTLVTRDMVLEKVEEIRGRECQISEEIKREAQSAAGRSVILS